MGSEIAPRCSYQFVQGRSRYQREIDYHRPLYPPLSPAEVDWLEKRLRE